MSSTDHADPDDAPQNRFSPYLKAGIVLLILAALGFSARPVYQQLKAWRAQQLITQAEQSLREKRPQEALQSARAAYQLGASDAKTLRLLAGILEKISPRDALGIYLALGKSEDVQASDLRSLARLSLALRELEVARAAINNLLRAEPTQIDNLLLAANLCLLQNDLTGARSYAHQAAWIDPQNRQTRFILAQLLALTPQTRPEAIRQFLALANSGSDITSLDALQILATLTDIPAAEATQIADTLERHPLSGLPQKLLATQLRIRLNPAQRATLYNQIIGTYAVTTDDRLTVARWLNQQQQYVRTLEIIPPTLAMQSQNLFLVRMDALAALNRWQEIADALNEKQVPLTNSIRELFLARCSRELGEKAEAEVHWSRAITEAGKDSDPNTLWFLADYALKLQERAKAWEVFQLLTQNPVTARRGYENLIRMAEQEGETARLLDVIRNMSRTFPSDDAVPNDITYLELLLEQNVPTALATAEKRFKAQPTTFAYRMTLALALLRTNAPTDALKLFQTATFSPKELLPGWQAIYAATLARNGKQDEARAIASSIPLDRIKPQERELIRGLR